MPFQGTRVPAAGHDAWQTRGACQDHDPELFFPEGDGPAVLVQAGTAKAICRSCPVAGTCLAWALSTQTGYGIWGGLTADERAAVLTARASTARAAGVPASTAEPEPVGSVAAGGGAGVAA